MAEGFTSLMPKEETGDGPHAAPTIDGLVLDLLNLGRVVGEMGTRGGVCLMAGSRVAQCSNHAHTGGGGGTRYVGAPSCSEHGLHEMLGPNSLGHFLSNIRGVGNRQEHHQGPSGEAAPHSI